jgi:hypothetical protein
MPQEHESARAFPVDWPFSFEIFFFFGIKIYLLLQPLACCGLTVIDELF